jgi:GT2 family glycosyltransferase
LTIIRNGTNRGFAAACNQGAADAREEYLLFLNPDTRLMRESLSCAIRFLEKPENRQMAAVGIQLVDDTGTVSRSCARSPTPGMFAIKMLGLDRIWPRWFRSHFMEEWNHSETRLVDHVIGAFYCVRREVFVTLGGFDERYFLYLEDLDLSHRIHEAGWRIAFLADTCAYHRGGGTSDPVRADRLYYAVQSRIRYGFKHFGLGAATAHAAGTLALEPFVRLAHAGVRGRTAEIAEVCSAWWRLWRSIGRRSSMRAGEGRVLAAIRRRAMKPPASGPLR